MNIHCIILAAQTDISQTNRNFSLKIIEMSTFSEITVAMFKSSHYVSLVSYEGILQISSSYSVQS